MLQLLSGLRNRFRSEVVGGCELARRRPAWRSRSTGRDRAAAEGAAEQIRAVLLVLAEIEARARAKDEETNRMIAVETVKANFGNAELIRQVAEIAVIEYDEGIFKQDEATASSEARWRRPTAAGSSAVEFSKQR